MIAEATAEGSNQQNNAISNMNTRRGQFSHFGTIEANPFRRFGIFGNNNNILPPENNNNNNPPPLLSLSGFGEGLGGGFNLLSERNARGLDSNVATPVNVLIRANLGINHVKRELNHIKLTEFGRIEAENPNEWLE